MNERDEFLIVVGEHPTQHCECGHLRMGHRPDCGMCAFLGRDCACFRLCPEHPGVPDWI